MLKLLIVDDEPVICNTIASAIDWNSLGIRLIGTCFDGVEAYHTILDEIPDIVMTDIRMPGISGLDLVERIYRTDLNVHFIILSGYGEFEYAKRAMKCGVRHYLLKPCDPDQIRENMIDIIKECQKDLSLSLTPQNLLLDSLQYTLIHNIISEGFTMEELTPSFFTAYEQYLNLYDVPFQLCYLYYLEKENLSTGLSVIEAYFKKWAPDLKVYKIYVSNILLLFFPNYDSDFGQLDSFLKNLSFEKQTVSITYERISFPDIRTLLTNVICKLKRYDIIYFIDGTRMIPNFNYGQIVSQCNQLILALLEPENAVTENTLVKIELLLASITNIDFLFQISEDILIKLCARIQNSTLSEIVNFFILLHTKEDLAEICSDVMEKLKEILRLQNTQRAVTTAYSITIEKIITYLHEHLSDPDLTLKWIAENYLYMNVNHVSRCFVKETGQKFSGYLMNLRIEKAKEILQANQDEKIQHVAELVGCGNNPYYFNKIFKKCTGISPSVYLKMLQSGAI